MKININYRVGISNPRETHFFDEPQDAEYFFTKTAKELINCGRTNRDRWPILDRVASGYSRDNIDSEVIVTLQTLSDGMVL